LDGDELRDLRVYLLAEVERRIVGDPLPPRSEKEAKAREARSRRNQELILKLGADPKLQLDPLVNKLREIGPVATVLSKPSMKLIELNSFLKQQYEDLKRHAKDGKVKTGIVLRADRDCQFGTIFRVLEMCKAIGFRDMNTRAMSKGGPTP
jgi:biopolymer transport protein ExbD